MPIFAYITKYSRFSGIMTFISALIQLSIIVDVKYWKPPCDKGQRCVEQHHAMIVELDNIIRIVATGDATFALPRSINSPWENSAS